MEPNQKAYELPAVVDEYAQEVNLLPAEIRIKEMFAKDIPSWAMLDIGIGCGRTTRHFASSVKEYVGIDYSRAMVEECSRRLSLNKDSAKVMWGDARQMEMFKTDHFDFVLFSYNGLDLISQADRLKVLNEIRRIGKPKGYFCFSSHNMQSAGSLRDNKPYAARFSKALRMWAGYFQMRAQVFFHHQLLKSPSAVIRDGAEAFRIQLYYIRPEDQIRQLHQAGLSDVKVFAMDGQEVADRTVLKKVTDRFVYYLCRIDK